MERTDVTFEDLGVIEPIRRRLSSRGVNRPFEIQALVLPDALAGRDILGKAKTGSGKTLAFGIPLVQRMQPGAKGTQGLVLVPTRELCSQVADEVRAISPKSARVLAAYGGVGLREHIEQAPHAHIIVATPGRLIDLLERRVADLSNAHILVIDEADRMADMGFLPQVTTILRHVPDDRQTMLFSATLDHQIFGLIAQTDEPARHEVADKQQTVDSVEHHLFEVHPMDKVEVLKAIVSSAPGLSLVFTRTKRGCDRLAGELKDGGVNATAIHGDLGQGAREQALKRFEGGKVDVLVATDVAARGLDIDDIARVINYDPPEDHKAYVHRVGRTARAGRSGVGITLATWEQRDEVELMARRLNLHPHIVEIFSSDERLGRLGTGEVVGAMPREDEDAEAVGVGAAAARKFGARRRGGGGGRRRRR